MEERWQTIVYMMAMEENEMAMGEMGYEYGYERWLWL